MAPPPKRRKRNIVDDSDLEDDGAATNNNSLTRYLLSSPDAKRSTDSAAGSRDPTVSLRPLRLRSGQTGSQLPRGSTKSPSTSPEKSRTRAQKKIKIEEKGKTADLLTLFSKQAQKNQSSSGKKDKTLDLEDIISDPISEDDDVAIHKTAASSIVGKNAQKRFKESSQSGTVASSASTNHRFLRPSKPAAGGAVDGDQRPWSERFGPVNLDELAVHKKKVADVRKWLEDAMGGRLRQRLLILKGAAGTGKTTTVQLLAKDMNCDVLEWRNPAGSLGANYGFQSASAQFEEFLGRGGKFGQLDLDSESDSQSSVPNGRQHDPSRKIILIEEFPNTFMRSSSALTSFRNNILQFLAINTPALATFGQQPATEPVTPIVMVISETLLTTTSASADSFTAHRLLGQEVLRHPGTGVIEFNAIAPSLLSKALELVVVKEARKSGRRRTPGPLVLKRLGEIGDIRSAISSLEFLCLKGDDDADWGSKVAFTKPKRGSKDSIALTRGEQETLELISQREASLGIFHAVGKVVYNKRDELPPGRGTPAASAEELPPHLAHHSRPRPSQVSVDALIDETGTDTHTFISALHENYILSCERTGSTDPLSSIDYINGCIEYLSESDLLCPSWDIFFGGRGFSGSYQDRNLGSHILRQDEMAFQVAVRGLLFSLPYPVKRQTAHAGRGGNDAYKMYYPTSLKLWRAKEETEGLLNMWATKILKGEDTTPGSSRNTSSTLTNGSAAFRRNKAPSSVGDWASTQRSLNYAPSQQPSKPPEKPPGQDPTPPPLLSLGTAARNEMLLERLPYMAHIARRRRCSFGTMGLRDLDKLVTFHGIGNADSDETPEDQDDAAAAPGDDMAWATDKPTEEPVPRKKGGLGAILSRGPGGAGGVEGSVVGGLGMQGLVLSDDDIEDD